MPAARPSTHSTRRGLGWEAPSRSPTHGCPGQMGGHGQQAGEREHLSHLGTCGPQSVSSRVSLAGWEYSLSLSHRKHLPSWADPGVSAREHLQEVLMGLGAASSWGLLCTQTLKTQMFEKYTCFLF